MTSSSGTTTDSSLSLTMSPASSAEGNVPPQAETSATFEDVLHQHGGGTSNTTPPMTNTPNGADHSSGPQGTSAPLTPGAPIPGANPPATEPVPASTVSVKTSADATIPPVAETAGPTSTTAASAKAKTPALFVGSDLSAMLIQAALRASNARNAPISGPSVRLTATTPGESDPGTGSDKTASDHPPTLVTPGDQLAALLAEARHIASKTPPTLDPQKPALPSMGTITALGKEIPLLGSSKELGGLSAKEKKSMAGKAEGSFLQAGGMSAFAGLGSIDLPGSPLKYANELLGNQQVTSLNGAKNILLNGLAGTASSVAGTANVEKEKAMNADLNLPQIFSGTGAIALSRQNSPNLHIQLASNQDFDDALKQVMHVAQLTQTNESRVPMRVAMEIQTPPGAVVNVYVSRQNDQWRAQLSTNDPQALLWVQDKMSSLRQAGDFGVDVRWLPPQMESGSGSESNLSWDRGGQGQANQQQHDDRQQGERQKRAGTSAAISATRSAQFSDTIHAVGRAG